MVSLLRVIMGMVGDKNVIVERDKNGLWSRDKNVIVERDKNVIILWSATKM